MVEEIAGKPGQAKEGALPLESVAVLAHLDYCIAQARLKRDAATDAREVSCYVGQVDALQSVRMTFFNELLPAADGLPVIRQWGIDDFAVAQIHSLPVKPSYPKLVVNRLREDGWWVDYDKGGRRGTIMLGAGKTPTAAVQEALKTLNLWQMLLIWWRAR